ncbi:unnamed protein product [Hydatigera taeniaeformis]|uniref:C2H2-type domain-containing protein n=1 Tax=Hydatigena taeniaeformis TaxID=6205 RepID=A0A0R3X725_HYDTA|nr:unnamed protein product [Hydatigera taeniaeformis]
MGGKESHMPSSESRGRCSAYGHTIAPSFPQFTNTTCQTMASSLYNADTFNCHRTHSDNGGNKSESSDQNLGGDVCCYDSNYTATKLNYKMCGDETDAEDYHKPNPSKSSQNKVAEHLCSEKDVKLTSIISNETDTSSSISVGDGSTEAILKKLKNRHKISKNTLKKTKKHNNGSQSSDGHSCISQTSSSSSPPSCCTPVLFVDLVKLKKTGVETKTMQQVALACDFNEAFNVNISNEQSSGDLPDQLPGRHGDEIETRNDPSSSHRLSPPPRGSEDTVNRWVTPKPSPKLGFVETNTGDIIFTAYLRMKGTGPDEYTNVKKTSERRLKGLQTQQNCKIKLYDDPIEQRTLMVHKLRIFGPGYREVIRCKNSLPRCLTDRLITAHATLDENMIKPQRRR